MYNEMLNGIIREKEVLDAIKGLKNNKAPGSDKLINELSVTSFAKKMSLVLTMDVNNLPKQLINVIALKLSGSVGHPLFL
jgi:hypothetical protein